jgi:hypothetical protein
MRTLMAQPKPVALRTTWEQQSRTAAASWAAVVVLRPIVPHWLCAVMLPLETSSPLLGKHFERAC